jgi:hypothetical protein
MLTTLKRTFAVGFGHDHFRAQRRVAVHVVDVVGERGVGVVDELETQTSEIAAGGNRRNVLPPRTNSEFQRFCALRLLPNHSFAAPE